MHSQHVLVTGGAGYTGSVLVHRLLASGRRVRVVDSLRFGGESLLAALGHSRFELIPGDIRDRECMQSALAGVDSLVHLAAVVGDPACAAEPDLAREVNQGASEQLYELADEAGVRRFVFASTCSNYGRTADGERLADETFELRPVSLYAETKVATERFLLAQSRARTAQPTCLRFATVYGLSPRPRFDLTVNEFTRDLVLGRTLEVYGAQFWRPYCHVRDKARAIAAVLEAPPDEVAFEVFNVGDTSENYTKQMVVAAILEQGVEGHVVHVERREDPRDYRVSFDKIQRRLGFAARYRVADGIREIAAAIRDGVIRDPDARRWTNLGPAITRRRTAASP